MRFFTAESLQGALEENHFELEQLCYNSVFLPDQAQLMQELKALKSLPVREECLRAYQWIAVARKPV